MTDLENAVFLAIARNAPSKQPAAVLAAIREAGYVVIRRTDLSLVLDWCEDVCGSWAHMDETEDAAYQRIRRSCPLPDEDAGDLDPSAEG